MNDQPEFNFEEVGHAEQAGESPAPVPVGDSGVSDWQEVPQARFLSWTVGEQNAYMRARDIDSAANADDPWWIEFYLERAKCYQ